MARTGDRALVLRSGLQGSGVRADKTKQLAPCRLVAGRILMTAAERKLLELLSTSADDCTELHLAANGFTLEVVVSLTHAGLATSTTQRGHAGGHAVDLTRIRITDAGRRALAGRADDSQA
jgi:hypothetical protein